MQRVHWILLGKGELRFMYLWQLYLLGIDNDTDTSWFELFQDGSEKKFDASQAATWWDSPTTKTCFPVDTTTCCTVKIGGGRVSTKSQVFLHKFLSIPMGQRCSLFKITYYTLSFILDG